jgi:hypothetical protein
MPKSLWRLMLSTTFNSLSVSGRFIGCAGVRCQPLFFSRRLCGRFLATCSSNIALRFHELRIPELPFKLLFRHRRRYYTTLSTPLCVRIAAARLLKCASLGNRRKTSPLALRQRNYSSPSICVPILGGRNVPDSSRFRSSLHAKTPRGHRGVFRPVVIRRSVPNND